MAGGIVFVTSAIRLRDQFGNRVMCTECGGESWDITLGGPAGERIECSAPDCGAPADAHALAVAAEIGNVIASTPPAVDVPGLVGWLRNEQQATAQMVTEYDPLQPSDRRNWLTGYGEALANVLRKITLG